MIKRKILSHVCAFMLMFTLLFGMLPAPVLADSTVPAAPIITTDLNTTLVTCFQEASLTRLSVKASTGDGGTLSYQWYSGADASHVTNTIGGETTYRYRPDTKTAGTTYYKVIVTNTLNGQTASTPSTVASVKVNPMALSVSVTESNGTTVPINGYQYNVGDTATTLQATGTANAPDNDVSSGAWRYNWYKVSTDGSISNAPGKNSQATYTPPTDKDGLTKYVCYGHFKLNSINYDYMPVTSTSIPVKVIANSAQAPSFSTQPVGKTYLINSSSIKPLSVSASVNDGGTLNYQWYVSSGNNGFTQISGATGTSYTPPTSAEGATNYYYCVTTNTLKSVNGHTYTSTTTSDTAAIIFKTVAEAGGTWVGNGTAGSPYEITNANDLAILQNMVNTQGFSFQGYTFKLTHDITLPSCWVPIGGLVAGQRGEGNGTNILPFSATLDGGGHTIIVPNGCLPLFGYVRFATVKNLNIYGTNIAGYGLVNNYCVDYGPTGDYGDWTATATYPNMPMTIVIDNVTLKSGSSTQQSGFIGGYASGANTVYIRNSKVESNVVIGSDKKQSDIGSFGGAFNGYIENCVSYATVYGINRVGGLIGSKGQSMGNCGVQDSAFYGTVVATGKYAGGILGSGYASPSAPNTPCVSIQNSYATGSITGSDYVGGLLGGEPACKQNWANGIGYIQNNYFTGTVTATEADAANIGGIIGYMNSLDRYNIISNNFYLNSCGASKGIGTVKAVDTVTTKTYNRTDDPTGTDVDKLCKSATAKQLADGTVTAAMNSGINSSGNWIQKNKIPDFGTAVHLNSLMLNGYKTIMTGGSILDLSGITAYGKYSDGTIKAIDINKVTFNGFNSDLIGYYTVTATYDNHTYIFVVQVYTNADYSDDVVEAKKAVSNAAYTFPMSTANTSDGVRTLIQDKITALSLKGVTATVTMCKFIPAVAAGTFLSTAGTAGSFTFTVNLTKGQGEVKVSDSVSLTGNVTATAAIDNSSQTSDTGTVITNKSIPVAAGTLPNTVSAAGNSYQVSSQTGNRGEVIISKSTSAAAETFSNTISAAGGGYQITLDKGSLTGNTIIANLGNVNVTFPENILESLLNGKTLTLWQQPLLDSQIQEVNSSLPSGNAIACSFNLNLTGADGTQIHELGGKIKVTFKLTDDQLAKITNASTAVLYYYNPSNRKLVKMDAGFDLKEKTVTFTTDHLSTFLVANSTNTSKTTSKPESGGNSNRPPVVTVGAVVVFIAALAVFVCLKRKRGTGR